MKKIIYTMLVIAAPALAQQLQCGPCTNPVPVREFGQPTLITPTLNSTAPNLVVGEELYNPSAIAFDTSVNPPRVYVADTGNNRVLGWSNANNLTAGNMADMVLGQQPSGTTGGLDFTATLAWGPGSADNIGLYGPTGVAVDAAGNVYVSDSRNNRILRYETPYQQQPGNQVVDLVIGQKGVASGGQVNQGQSTPSATTLALAISNSSGALLPAGLAFDSAGNLWAADPGNNRVLMYPASSLNPSNSSIAATVALGQSNFTSNQLPSGFNQLTKTALQAPTTVAVDNSGTVYVTDSTGRALVFPNPSLGTSASTVLGVAPTPAQGQTVTYPTQSTLGAISGTSITASPQGIFTMSANGSVSVFVCDSPQNRVVEYTSITIPSNANSPQQTAVIGQNGYSLGQPNQGLNAPTNQSFSNPVAGAIRPDNGEMWIVDQVNNRVIAFTPQTGASFTSASRVLGQKDFGHGAVNLLEGRELWFAGGGGIAFDTSSCTGTAPNVTCSNPPYLYIADTENNRVLGFKNALHVGVDPTAMLTQTADIVIGQAQGDLQDNMVNYPNNAASQPSATGLNHPVGLAVDSQGNLWVADSGNSRVVRFPAPFAQTGQQTANLVLGQNSLTSYVPGVTQFLMETPFGLTQFSNGSLAVSDPLANRILVFAPTGGGFSSGQAAAYVIGQTGFSQSGSGNSSSQLSSPRHLAVDSSDRLYVCDFSNDRLLVFNKPVGNNPAAVASTNVDGQPEAIAVSFATGLGWLAVGNGVIQIPEISNFQETASGIQTLQAFATQNNAGVATLAVALDPFDDVVVADNSNRVTFYYDELFYRNTANYTAGLGSGTTAGPTPTMLAELHLWGSNFNFTPSYSGSAVANMALPWPTTYTQGSTTLQVTVAGIPAPIMRVDTASVNDGDVIIEIPNEAPSSGQADFVIADPATGQIYAAAQLAMQQSSPGIYTTNASGAGPAAALNYDSKGNPYGINSASNQVSRGDIIDLWLTGAGNVPGLPADGAAPGQGVPTPINPTVFVGGQVATVVGSGMSSQFPGVWQVNAIVPQSTPPGAASVVVTMNGYASNYLGTGTDTNPGADQQVIISNSAITTIYVK